MNLDDYIEELEEAATRRPQLGIEIAAKPRGERMLFFERAIKIDQMAVLAHALKNEDADIVAEIVQLGLHDADSSSMKWYLSLGIRRLGFLRICSDLVAAIQEGESRAESAVYWLRTLSDGASKLEIQALTKVLEMAKSRGFRLTNQQGHMK